MQLHIGFPICFLPWCSREALSELWADRQQFLPANSPSPVIYQASWRAISQWWPKGSGDAADAPAVHFGNRCDLPGAGRDGLCEGCSGSGTINIILAVLLLRDCGLKLKCYGDSLLNQNFAPLIDSVETMAPSGDSR